MTLAIIGTGVTARAVAWGICRTHSTISEIVSFSIDSIERRKEFENDVEMRTEVKKRVNGCFFNVVGLPLAKFFKVLDSFLTNI